MAVCVKPLFSDRRIIEVNFPWARWRLYKVSMSACVCAREWLCSIFIFHRAFLVRVVGVSLYKKTWWMGLLVIWNLNLQYMVPQSKQAKLINIPYDLGFSDNAVHKARKWISGVEDFDLEMEKVRLRDCSREVMLLCQKSECGNRLFEC